MDSIAMEHAKIVAADLNHRLKIAEAKLKALDWIPVSEGLPEETGEYLVLPRHKHCPVLWYQDGWYWYNHRSDAISETIGYNEEPIFEVTHFMPIPGPSEEGSDAPS